VRVETLCRQRRVAILLSAVVAAFHADVLTMAAIAIPLYGMYEISILTVRLFGGAYSRGEDPEPVPAPVEPGLGPPPAA
jgi:sec-independent protein translocase protein TatC